MIRDGLIAAMAAAATTALLAGCTTLPVAVAECPAIKTYTPAQDAALADALAALPDGSPLAGAMIDYGQLRAEARACAAAK
ncbi:MAG TPA: hypothetical protein VMU59_09240 [Caulobacteraceae bacterium]|nr:hypothetical protein [Caulobacteraceae bacterium]